MVVIDCGIHCGRSWEGAENLTPNEAFNSDSDEPRRRLERYLVFQTRQPYCSEPCPHLDLLGRILTLDLPSFRHHASLPAQQD